MDAERASREIKSFLWKHLPSVIVQGVFSSLLQIAAAENFKGLFNLQHFYTVLALRRKEGRQEERREQQALCSLCSWFILYNACCVAVHLAHCALAKSSHKWLLREEQEQDKYVQCRHLMLFQPSIFSSLGTFRARYSFYAFSISSMNLFQIPF